MPTALLRRASRALGLLASGVLGALILAVTLGAATLPARAGGTDITAMTDAEREAFRREVRQYLLDNPEVILEVIRLLEDRQRQAAAAHDAALIAAHAKDLFDDGLSWVGGNPEGDVTVVEFLDYRCGYCRKAHPEVKALIEKDGNIRYIVKEFPILGEQSLASSRLAIAALITAGPEVYARLRDALMELDQPLTDALARALLEDAGAPDPEAVLAARADPRVDAHIRRMHRLAQALRIEGTPGFVIGDRVIRGYVPGEQLAALVAEARKAAAR
ncbi:MAG: DsbA family protein [Alphaproteobacteria bacterium]|nr:MAG: DsbA family protein [Alphaproteobacteria bacterium]